MISSQLKRLYDADFNESLSSVKQAMSIEDQRALAILESSACLRNGHYQLPLPWRFKSPCLPNNRDVAVRRMGFLERLFQKDAPPPPPFLRSTDRLLKTTSQGATPREFPMTKSTLMANHCGTCLIIHASFSSPKTWDSKSCFRLRSKIP